MDQVGSDSETIGATKLQEASEEESTTKGEESEEEEEGGESDEGEDCSSDPPTSQLLIRPRPETQPKQNSGMADMDDMDDMDDVRELTPKEMQAGKNPKAPRQFIPCPHIMALVAYYERLYATYCQSIAPKKPSQLVPNKVWKDVWAAYKHDFPNSTFKEECLKDPLRQQLRDLAKEKEKPNFEEEGGNPTQDEELLTRLMATESWRAKGLLQERLAVADRISGDSGKKKDSSSQPATPAVGSSMSGQTNTVIGSIGERSQRKNGMKSQNLKDAKDGINSMLDVMTSMNDEKKQENTRKRQLAEGKATLHEAKCQESEERSCVLAAQKNALAEQAKMNRFALLKEQKALGLIDDE